MTEYDIENQCNVEELVKAKYRKYNDSFIDVEPMPFREYREWIISFCL